MNYYDTSQAFDKEMSQLFLKARRWFVPGTEPYGNVLALQVRSMLPMLLAHYLTPRLSSSNRGSTKLSPLLILRSRPTAPLPTSPRSPQDRAQLHRSILSRETLPPE